MKMEGDGLTTNLLRSRAQLKRAVLSQEVPEDNLRRRPIDPDEQLSRRELFGMVRPRYEVIPFIDNAACGMAQGCLLCAESCPVDAIVSGNRGKRIEKKLCSGCGACVTACPRKAVIYPTFTHGELDRVMEGLLREAPSGLHPGIMTFTCREERDRPCLSFANFLPLQVPCLALVSAWVLLRAFDRGAQGVAVISGKRGCRMDCDLAQAERNVGFVRELLKAWSMEPGRIQLFNPGDSHESDMERELEAFARKMEGLPSTGVRPSQTNGIHGMAPTLAALVQGRSEKLGHSDTGIVARGCAPFGIVEVDSSRCTGCGLCAPDCPTEALSLQRKGEDDSYRILFQHDLCVGCGLCGKFCPEQCINVERGLDLSRIGEGPSILFEDRICRCRDCGNPLFPQAMVSRLRSKMSAAGNAYGAMDLCPVCRLKRPWGGEIFSDTLTKQTTV
jgi:ferredoxin/coenzyme F420-reducing hydrogenase delta subunit